MVVDQSLFHTSESGMEEFIFITTRSAIDLVKRCTKRGVVTKEGIENILDLLIVENPLHPDLDLRRSLGLDF